MNNCPKCGNPLQPGVSTCPICGTMINQAPAAQPAPGAPAPVAPVPPAPPAGVPVQPAVTPMAQPAAPAPGAMPMQGGVPTPTAPGTPVPPPPAPAAPVPPPPAPGAPAPGAPAPGTPAALAAQAQATASVPAPPEKKKSNKKLFIIGGIVAAVVVVASIVIILINNNSSSAAPTQPTSTQPAPVVARTTTVSVGNYDFQRPEGWSNSESSGYVYITKDDESVVIVLNKTSTSLEHATVDSMKAAAAGQRLKDPEVQEMTVGDKKAFFLSATYNELPVEYYYIDYNTATVIVSVVYTKEEYKDTSSGEVANIVNTIVYNESTKAADTYNNYIYNTLVGQSIMFASINDSNPTVPSSDDQGSSNTPSNSTTPSSSNTPSSSTPSSSNTPSSSSTPGSSTTPSGSNTPDQVTPSSGTTNN